MRRRLFVLLLLAAMLLGEIAVLWWRRHSRTWGLSAGTYELSLVATRGSRQGKTVQGPLVLRPTTKTDRSPKTGMVAQGGNRDLPLYGWLDLDLLTVGVPLCLDGPAPPPSSRDPVFPGVVVLAVDPAWHLGSRVKRPPDAPILATGTLLNIRDGKTRLDGCGIGLFVQTRSGGCWRGEWAEFGLAYDGAGTFSICPAHETSRGTALPSG